MKKVLGILGAAAIAGAASGQVTLPPTVVEVPNTIDGFNTFDILIDFVGEYSGTQILSELDTGTFFAPSGGGDSPPTEFVLGLAPDVAFDTFFAQGGLSAETTVGTLTIGAGGGPVNIDETLLASVISDTLIQTQYNPSGADFIADQSDFLVARITVSDDANGSFLFFASANDDLPDPVSLPIIDGAVTPEPATAALLGLGGLAMLRRRSA